MKKQNIFFVGLCLVLIFISIQARGAQGSIEPKDIPLTAVIEETGDILHCTGIAVYKHYFKNYYMGAFYTQNKISNAFDALHDKGSKRMLIIILSPIIDFKGLWKELINENTSPLIVEREQINISQFLKTIDYPLHKGDVVVLDYVPNIGTKISVKGSSRGIIKGSEFYNLILKGWMGRQPPSRKFKNDLFNFTKSIHR